ncbi:MAG: N-acetylglucosamine-6-phosphate deacetylase [Bifidobacterium sp.]|nr:N-acetylglucosamine-6-phosphate deacetylase [Bifidobacterium sp.]
MSGAQEDSRSGACAESDERGRERVASRIAASFGQAPEAFGVVNATRVDARGVLHGAWIVCADGIVVGSGTDRAGFEACARSVGLDPASAATAGASSGGTDAPRVLDAEGRLLVPGYMDIHAHGAWGCSFDDGAEAIAVARAGHMVHGTTRQVLSLITNPMDVMARNLRTVRRVMDSRPDVLGAHCEGPFLSPLHKGAHDPGCLRDPDPASVATLLEAADGCLRQITIAPELDHAMEAIHTFTDAGVVCAVGHTDTDYATAVRAFDAGASLLTHLFNAMPGLEHRKPGPIPAASEDPRVSMELINDGFHVQDPALRLALRFAPERTLFVTDAMAATDMPDGRYKLGALDVEVKDTHARLVSNGAIAGSTLLLEHAVSRGVLDLRMAPGAAVAAATLLPARALGLDRPNAVTGAPLGLLAPGYAADVLLLDPQEWSVERVWCDGRPEK